MSTTDLWLIRHGETARSTLGRCYGSLDVPLSPVGLDQIQTLAASIPAQTFQAIYSSPRVRCVHSARVLATGQGCPVTVDPDLAELDFGEFEGRSYDEIAASFPEFYSEWMTEPTTVSFPQGESFALLQKRVLQALSRVLHRNAGSRIAIVAHGGVNRIILADALQVPPVHIFRLGQRYASLNHIRYYDAEPVVELLNGNRFPAQAPAQ